MIFILLFLPLRAARAGEGKGDSPVPGPCAGMSDSRKGKKNLGSWSKAEGEDFIRVPKGPHGKRDTPTDEGLKGMPLFRSETPESV
jgi:hypothetical protein